MTDVTRMADLTDRQFAALPPDTVVLVPLGSLEPHGHLPMGTDTYIAEQILERIAARVARTCLMPSLPLGYLFKYAKWPGAVAVPAEVVSQSLLGIASACAAVGLRRLFVMSGHDENREAALLGLRDANLRHATLSVYCDWLDLAVSLAATLSTSKREGHGSEIQTSVLRCLRPDFAIDLAAVAAPSGAPPAIGDDDLFAEPEAGMWVRPARGLSSYTGDPSPASAAKGELIVERVVNRSVEIVEALRRTSDADA